MSRRNERRSPGPWFLILGLILTGALMMGLGRSLRWHWIPAYLAAVNLATAALYGMDKALAILGRIRIPERTLHIFAFAGGTPGALLAQEIFRHKTAKASFRRTFWILALVQAALVAWAWWCFGA